MRFCAQLVGWLRPQAPVFPAQSAGVMEEFLRHPPDLADAKNEKSPYARDTKIGSKGPDGIEVLLSSFGCISAQIQRIRQRVPGENIKVVLDMIQRRELWLQLLDC